MGKRKTIVCLETGKQFNSVENAANAIGVSSGFISRQIKAGKSRISSKGTEEAALWSALRPESAMSPSKPLRRSMETDWEAPGRGLAFAVKIPIAPLTANIGAIQMIWSQE